MKTRDSKWLALVSVVLIGFTQWGSVIRPPAKPSDIAKEYIYHLYKGEFEAAAKLMSAQMFARMSAQMSPRWLESKELDNAKTAIKEDLKDKGGVKTIETQIEDIVGEAAKVALITIFNNGQVDMGYFTLVKESGGGKSLAKVHGESLLLSLLHRLNNSICYGCRMLRLARSR